jgi:hypothetical protein
MLLPFEGIGVHSHWEFSMPKAANLFDYDTIADVLFTIDYTALDSFDYRQQVIRQLDNIISADRPFSFPQQFADQWWELHNPDQSATPMTVRFQTARDDFPPNIDGLRIAQVLLYFALKPDASPFEEEVQLHFTYAKPTTPPSTDRVGGAAVPVDGLISTRRLNAAAWLPITNPNHAPVGEWELALPVATRNRFESEEVQDILFVLTYASRTPDWPS